MMDEKVFKMISDHAHRKVIQQYERESDLETANIVSTDQVFEYIQNQIDATRAHSERYTNELAKGLINFYENRKF